MAHTASKLLPELIALHRLTETEAAIAETRRAQATTDAVERELARNAGNCRERADAIRQVIVELGGVPDTVGTLIGRANAGAKTAVEQLQTLTGALLSDLALEHELQDRARFLRVMAQTDGETRVVRLAERLEAAHGETIEWINTRLAEVAVGGPSDLRPTPTQLAVGTGVRLAVLPTRQLTTQVNRAVAVAGTLQERVGAQLEQNIAKARQLQSAAVTVFAAGRNAALRRSEQEADKRGDRSVARSVRRTRAELGALDADELPIKRYDTLGAPAAENAIRKLDGVADVRAILAYETQNKDRKGVTAAAQSRIEELAKELAGV